MEARHAYTVTRVVDITKWFSSEHHLLIRLRNPHGASDGWDGDWSDKCQLWQKLPSEEKEKLKPGRLMI